MLRVNEIMTEEVVTVPPEMSVRDAMSLLVTHHITGAPVVAQGNVIGVVSLTDLAEIAATSPGAPTARPDSDADWGEWNSDDELPEGVEPPSEFFSDLWDDAGVDVSSRVRVTEGPEWSALDDLTVEGAMTQRICSLEPTTSVTAAANYMRNSGIHRVLIMDKGRLLGILSTTDIAKAVADRKIARKVFVFGHASTVPGRR